MPLLLSLFNKSLLLAIAAPVSRMGWALAGDVSTSTDLTLSELSPCGASSQISCSRSVIALCCRDAGQERTTRSVKNSSRDAGLHTASSMKVFRTINVAGVAGLPARAADIRNEGIICSLSIQHSASSASRISKEVLLDAGLPSAQRVGGLCAPPPPPADVVLRADEPPAEVLLGLLAALLATSTLAGSDSQGLLSKPAVFGSILDPLKK